MDPLLILELIERNPGWEIVPLPGDQGIFVGDYNTFLRLVEDKTSKGSY